MSPQIDSPKVVSVSGQPPASIGLGAMVMSGYYGAADDSASRATVTAALDAGMTWIDTADSYGVGHNERLLAPVVAPRRAEVFLCTKFGLVHQEVPGRQLRINGRPNYARAALEASLTRLDTDYVDLWYLHRVDPDVPVEETVGAMADCVNAGLVRHLGLCEAEPDEIRRAHATHPILALQTEFSLVSREPEAELVPTVNELGIMFVPYGPVGRGLLGGLVAGVGDLEEDDQRHRYPRWQGAALDHNLTLARQYDARCRSWGLAPAVVALAWLRQAARDVLPIPGTRRRDHVRENLTAASVTLTSEQLGELEELFAPGRVRGERWPAKGNAVKLPWNAAGSRDSGY